MIYYVPALVNKHVSVFLLLLCTFIIDFNDGLTLPKDTGSTENAQFAQTPKSVLSKSTDDAKPTIKSPNNVSSNEDVKTELVDTTHTKTTTTEAATAKTTIMTEIPVTTTTAFPIVTPADNSGMKDGECPSILGNLDMLTQNQFSSILTHDCRYDKLTKPFTHGPLNVTLQIDIGHIEAVEQLQFKMHMLIQYRYMDHRLNYQKISVKRGTMLGEDLLRSKIWIPHIILSNERDTTIMGLEGKDVFVSISPQGEVIYSYRMTAQIYCWMDLKKFPFDEQVCDIHFKSWTYNASDLLLQWDQNEPVKVASQLHLTEFSLTDHWSYSTVSGAPLAKSAFVGNYSVLVFKFKLSREVGYYIMDYFVPSIMLVITSWVTFWLQADNTAPRVTLGTSTMLSFITLASVQSKNLPKVSYIKASEIWFLGCTMFIFASMTEFAFVNIVWRRTKKVELKKVNSKYILKSTLTPRLARKELQRSSSMKDLHKSHSCSSLDVSGDKSRSNGPSYNNYLTVHSFTTIPTITTQSEEELMSQKNNKQSSDTMINIPENQQSDENQNLMAPKWTTMTPQEIANWIDKRARIVFPVAFLIFNIFYWTFVYSL